VRSGFAVSKAGAPGEAGKIEVSVKTEGQTALNKSVTVTTNDPSQPQITLNLTANVVPEFVLSERNIYFGSVPPGKEAVKNPGHDRARPAVKLISAESTDATSPYGWNRLRVRTESRQAHRGPEGGRQARLSFRTVKVKTTSALRPELNISARGWWPRAPRSEAVAERSRLRTTQAGLSARDLSAARGLRKLCPSDEGFMRAVCRLSDSC